MVTLIAFKPMKKAYLFALLAIVFVAKPPFIQAQVEDVEALVQRIDSLKEADSIFRFGLSIGPRITFEEKKILRRRNASISPIDSTLHFDGIDRLEVTIAGVVAAYPFARSEICFIKNLGFLAKLNLADFGPSSFVANKVIQQSPFHGFIRSNASNKRDKHIHTYGLI